MNDLKQTLANYASKPLAQRKTWYSPAATAYNQVRPRYPASLVNRAIEVAQLSTASTLLEVGCGPGIATSAFAPLIGSILGLEPNPNFCQFAQQNCAAQPNVEIRNTSFEEWTLEAEQFDAVLAATSFHWIPASIGFPKAAQSLHGDGYLILLWNMQLQPRYEVYESLSEIYQIYAPALDRHETVAAQTAMLQDLGQTLTNSGHFKPLVAEQVLVETIYTVDDYLLLLNTYSPYLELEPGTRDALFAALKHKIEQDFGGELELSYLSAFHIAQKG